MEKWTELQMLVKAGRRLKKRPFDMSKRYYEQQPTTYVAQSQFAPARTYFHRNSKNNSDQWTTIFGFEIVGAHKLKRTRFGNLAEEDYRYFAGHPSGHSTFSQCRACLTICRNKTDRQVHGKKGCNVVLAAAYKILYLERDNSGKGVPCVVCREVTNGTKWGAPICSGGECHELFRFHVVRPKSLRAAIILGQEETDAEILVNESS